MNEQKNITWHDKHKDNLSIGQRLADAVAGFMGSWYFIILQTTFVVLWMAFNVVAFIFRWDPYPFILLNLLFSTQAAYAAPIIMMSQNRQAERDRFHAEQDYKTDVEAKRKIEELQKVIFRIENEKLPEILNKIDELKPQKSRKK